MTQKSWPWSTVAGLGDGAAQLGEADSRLFLATWFGVQNPAVEGVSKGVGGELAVTGVASPLSVATGSGICYGLYINDATVTLAVATPAIGTTGGRVVLQTNWAGTGGAGAEARTRLVAKRSADGSASIPSLTQVVGTTWEVSLATFQIATNGAITVTDDRTFRKSTSVVRATEIVDLEVGTSDIANLAVTTAKIDNLAVTEAKMAAAASGKLVTNGDSHDHNGGDGANIPAGGLADGAVNTTAKLANDIVDDTKAGDRIPQFIRRQGGHASIWSTVGANNYTPGAVRMQAGVLDLVVLTGGNSGSVTITFPIAFSNVPIVLISVASGIGDLKMATVDTVTATQLTVTGNTTGTSSDRHWNINWLAIGPE